MTKVDLLRKNVALVFDLKARKYSHKDIARKLSKDLGTDITVSEVSQCITENKHWFVNQKDLALTKLVLSNKWDRGFRI